MAKKVWVAPEFEIGDFVYLKTDPDQIKRVVLSILICPGDTLMYLVNYGDNDPIECYAFELSFQIDPLLKEQKESKDD